MESGVYVFRDPEEFLRVMAKIQEEYLKEKES